jgi:AraC-like DNA-binding protein
MDLWPGCTAGSNDSPTSDGVLAPAAWLTGPDVSVVASLTDLRRPRADEILLARNVGAAELTRWLYAERSSDRLTARATEAAWAIGTLAETGACAAGQGEQIPALVAVQPESISQALHWRMLVSRPGRRFGEGEAMELCALLRALQARFNAPSEPGSIRLLVGSDGRVIHTDPAGQMSLAAAGLPPVRVAGELQAIRQQRWDEPEGDSSHDLAVELGGRAWWVVMEKRRAAALPGSEHWFVELRTLEDQELPTVGLLADKRIARALGYLHDHYRRGPGLAEVAHHAHISPFHFHRLFSRLVGVSPKQYLQMKQLQAARWRLRSHRAPIGRIAREAGFSSHGHFTATFRRLVGLSPTSYRNRAWE